jgi:hypothetical protein
MSAAMDIAGLRAAERAMDMAAAEADRLCFGLMGRYACDFVLAENMPLGCWVRLPSGWQSGVAGLVAVEWGKPPVGYRGAVAVSLETLRWLAKG